MQEVSWKKKKADRWGLAINKGIAKGSPKRGGQHRSGKKGIPVSSNNVKAMNIEKGSNGGGKRSRKKKKSFRGHGNSRGRKGDRYKETLRARDPGQKRN